MSTTAHRRHGHSAPTPRRSSRARVTLAATVFLAALSFVPGSLLTASADTPSAGSAGTVTSLPFTPSQVVVKEPNQAAGNPYSNLSVTVNQTQNLVNQDISVSWTGGVQTTEGPGNFSGNYLQIFECWGDPETTNPPVTTSDPASTSDPGPPPSQCEFGGESSTPTTSYPIQSSAVGFEYSRTLTQSSWPDYGAFQACTGTSSPCTYPGYSGAYNDTTDGYVVEPFDAVDGTVVGQQADYNNDVNPLAPLPFWLNPYYSFDTTNEVDFAQTYSTGDGQQLFQVDTGLEAPGLGCGQDIEPTAGGGTTTPQCWLVVVPRSTPSVENPAGVQPSAVVTSPLTPSAWANRIAIPLQFNPVGSGCAINAASEGIEGSELAAQAVSSWQPALCGQSGSTSYSYLENSDDLARQNLTDPSYGSVGMSVFTDPIDPSQTSSANPVVYAPLTLSGVVIGFNIERVPAIQNGTPVQSEVPLSGSRIASINLTPLLVAKLLTESYKGQFEEISAVKPSGYDWLANNPQSLFTDPEFLQYNPEFSLLTSEQQVDAGTLLVEEANTDAAATLWKWVLSDPPAASWLAGNPDNGMYVNPVYSTNPNYKYNTSATTFGTPAPESFPKSDPYCEALSGESNPPIVTGTGSSQTSTPARPLCFLDWSPYAQSMQAAAQAASAANDLAKTTYNATASSADSAWSSNGPQTPGTDLVMTVTDSASATLYGLQMASLSPAGDDPTTGNPTFVTPDATSMLAGVQGMAASPVTGVLQPNPSTTTPGAYPLTMLTYAAATPEALAPADRANYASFIKYAAQAGQSQGTQPGQLPPGYVPLPASLQAQALTAAGTILNPPVISTPTAPTSSAAAKAATTTTSPAAGPSGGTTTSPSPSGSTATGTGTESPPASTTPSTAPASKQRALPSTALSSERIIGFPIGALRWVLPIGLLVGLLAGLAGLGVSRLCRRQDPVSGPQPPTSASGP